MQIFIFTKHLHSVVYRGFVPPFKLHFSTILILCHHLQVNGSRRLTHNWPIVGPYILRVNSPDTPTLLAR